ncbi:hypothetical protein BT69DRAFT_1357783 [Atractiella rhizophila]|nr:hypothetical protein BT69DRAFT_1357783 [Atractiella rhizophila]
MDVDEPEDVSPLKAKVVGRELKMKQEGGVLSLGDIEELNERMEMRKVKVEPTDRVSTPPPAFFSNGALGALSPNSPRRPKLEQSDWSKPQTWNWDEEARGSSNSNNRTVPFKDEKDNAALATPVSIAKANLHHPHDVGKLAKLAKPSSGQQFSPLVPTANGSSPPCIDHSSPLNRLSIVPQNKHDGRVTLPFASSNQLPTDSSKAIAFRGASLPRQYTQKVDANHAHQEEASELVTRGTKNDAVQSLMKKAADGDFEGEGTTVAEAMKRLGLPDQNTILPGSEMNLLPHQILGVSWMVDQENSRNKGGILADEMGLGKTIQTIGLIVQNPSDDPRRATTLIIAPLGLLEQWKNEINTYANDLEVLIYHSSGQKVKTIKELKQYDVVLTNYHTVRAQWPDDRIDDLGNYIKPKKKPKKKSDGLDHFVVNGEGLATRRTMKAGPLLEMDWYRVVLDEAHEIRTPTSIISRAITRGLEAEYRTPLINGVMDAFPLLKFIRLPVYSDYNNFVNHVVTGWGPDKAGEHLQVLLKSCMFRRKKTSTLEGKPILTLPSKTIENVEVEFSEGEQQLYDFVARKEQAKFNKFFNEGTVLKNFHQVLVMLLRLRQLCNHPCLITEEMNPYALSPKELKAEVSRAAKYEGYDFVTLLKRTLRDRYEAKMEAEKKGTDVEIYDACPVCREPLEDSLAVAPCAHIFCSSCLEKIWKSDIIVNDTEKEVSIKYAEDQRHCPTCNLPILRKHSYNVEAFEPSHDDMLGKKRLKAMRLDAEVSGDEEEYESDDGTLDDFIVDDDEDSDAEWLPNDKRKKSRKKKGKSKKAEKRQAKYKKTIDSEDEEMDERKVNAAEVVQLEQAGADFATKLRAEDENKPFSKQQPEDEIMRMVSKFDGGDKMLPSAKMIWMLSQLRSWEASYPDDKVVIISQWTSCLDLLSAYLHENGMKHVNYRGDMKAEERSKTVAAFQTGRVKYMLLSLKCGGVGLNLTKGNRIIHFDLAWSEAVEAQAFDRCHRIGQRKPVVVNRISIKGSVEEKIKALQERKRSLVQNSLGEGDGKKLGRLSVKDLCFLFGASN